jgi:CRISPR-associated protein Csb2
VSKKPPAKLLKERAKAMAPYPGDLVAAMCAETGWLQAQGWSSPPGSQEVVYWRRQDALEVGAMRPAVSAARSEGVPFALLALSTPSRNRSGLPADLRVFPQGRLLHKALAAAVDRTGAGAEAIVLLGRDGAKVAKTNHRHAHLLHLDLDGDGRLDHALVWAPNGLGKASLRALRAIRRTWMKGGVGELQVAVAAVCDRASLRPLDEVFQGRLSAVLGPKGGAREWASLTPFLAPRMTKKRGKDSLLSQVQTELTRRGLPGADVTILPPHGELRLSFRHYVLHDREHRPPMPVAHALRLRFERPVEGPVCLGWGSHYGLGQFVVASADESDRP